jgi:hypothetical protein
MLGLDPGWIDPDTKNYLQGSQKRCFLPVISILSLFLNIVCFFLIGRVHKLAKLKVFLLLAERL